VNDTDNAEKTCIFSHSGRKEYCVFFNLLNEPSQTSKSVALKFVVGYRVDNPSP
jgi:hypothetical protein